MIHTYIYTYMYDINNIGWVNLERVVDDSIKWMNRIVSISIANIQRQSRPQHYFTYPYGED